MISLRWDLARRIVNVSSCKNFGANLEFIDQRNLFREPIVKLRFNLLDHINPNLSRMAMKRKGNAKKFEYLAIIDPLLLKVLQPSRRVMHRLSIIGGLFPLDT